MNRTVARSRPRVRIVPTTTSTTRVTTTPVKNESATSSLVEPVLDSEPAGSHNDPADAKSNHCEKDSHPVDPPRPAVPWHEGHDEGHKEVVWQVGPDVMIPNVLHDDLRRLSCRPSGSGRQGPLPPAGWQRG